MRIHYWISAIVIALFLGLLNSANACSCEKLEPPCEAYRSATAVFIGQIIDSSNTSIEMVEGNKKFSYQGRSFRFSVEQVFKGVKGTELEVETGAGGGDCGYGFSPGIQYLVYAYRDSKSKKLNTDICTRTSQLSEATDDLDYLRGLSNSEPTTRLSGTVTQYANNIGNNRFELVRSLTGIKIIITGRVERYEAITDENGFYKIISLKPGHYKVRAELPQHLTNYFEEDEVQEVNITGRGCAVADFVAASNGHISGRIVDAGGQAVPEIAVDLISADGYNGEYTFPKGERVYTDKSGRYELTKIPPGRYLIGFSLTRPPEGTYPYPRTYFPSTTNLATAKVLVLGDGEKLEDLNLQLPAPLVVRSVTGILLWSNGTPVTDGHVSIGKFENDSTFGIYDYRDVDAQGRFILKVLEGTSGWIHAYARPDGTRVGMRMIYARPLRVVANNDLKSLMLVIPLPNRSGSDPSSQEKRP